MAKRARFESRNRPRDRSVKVQKRQPILNKIEPQTEGQQQLLTAILSNEITICDGPAGTGKTLMAFYCALEFYLAHPIQRKIVIVRPTIPAGDDNDLGFLPGSLNDKMGPFIAPFIRDAAPIILNNENFRSNLNHLDRGAPDPMTSLLSRFDIEIVPLQFMRGRTFHNSFVILDEAQNCTLNEFKLFLSRIGQDSKVVVEGDSTQADRDDGALYDLQERMRGAPGVAIVQLSAVDIMRNPLIAELLRRLN